MSQPYTFALSEWCLVFSSWPKPIPKLSPLSSWQARCYLSIRFPSFSSYHRQRLLRGIWCRASPWHTRPRVSTWALLMSGVQSLLRMRFGTLPTLLLRPGHGLLSRKRSHRLRLQSRRGWHPYIQNDGSTSIWHWEKRVSSQNVQLQNLTGFNAWCYSIKYLIYVK